MMTAVNEVNNDKTKKSKAPVYLLKGSRDVLIYRGLMGTATVGLGYVAYLFYMMATGKLKKKERS